MEGQVTLRLSQRDYLARIAAQMGVDPRLGNYDNLPEDMYAHFPAGTVFPADKIAAAEKALALSITVETTE